MELLMTVPALPASVLLGLVATMAIVWWLEDLPAAAIAIVFVICASAVKISMAIVKWVFK
jgi:hypothetical protein